MNFNELNITKDNYSIKLRKEYKQNSILINCENNNNKKSYITELNSESILLKKSLDEPFQLLYEWIKGNNSYIKEKNDEIIIEVNDKNKNVLISFFLKQDNSNTTISTDKNNYGYGSEIGGEHFGQFFTDSVSSIQKNTESKSGLDMSNSTNLSIQLFIPNIDILNNSCANLYKNLLFNSIRSKNKGKKFNELTDLLKLCLLKKISLNLMRKNDIQNVIKPELMNILIKLDENIHLTGYSNRNLETMINEKKIYNILSYSNYLKNLDNSVLNIDIIRHLLNLTNEKKEENEEYWDFLSLFQEYNEHFEKTFIKDLKNCYFDYSLVSINCVLSDNQEENEKRNSEYKKKKILYHYSDISKIFHEKLNIKQDENNFYDNFEFFAFNSIKKEKKEKRKIIPINSTFSFIVSEIFFQEELISSVIGNYNQSSLNNENIILNKSSIHSVYFEDENLKQKNKSLGYYYTIKEKSQILPLYTVTLKRNEYFVLHRDQNLNGENEHSQFLRNIQNKNHDIFDINIYYESSTEEALDFLLKRKYNKVILITNVGPNLEGKRFVDIVRKIYGFDVLVLFFSHNKKHLEWIKDYNNSLFTDNIDYYREFITNFNEIELKNIKKKLEKDLSIQFKFTFDFISFPNYKSKGTFSSLNFKCEYFRQGYFKNGNNYLYMSKEGNVSLKPEKCKWAITLLNNEITLFSNGFYLDAIEDTEKIQGSKNMVIWGFETNDRDNYNFFIKSKDNNNYSGDRTLSTENEEIKVTKILPGKNETFIFNDSLEDCLENTSYLSENIESVENSIKFNSNMSL